METNFINEKNSLRIMNDADLLSSFGKVVQTERKITHLILEYIAEIDQRKLYLEKAYPSLYEFLVSGHGYSSSSALRRIESARLLQEVPEIAQKIESGALNLSQISMVSQSIRQFQKIENRKVEAREKLELLSKIEYSNQRQTEQIIAQEFNLPINKEEKLQIHQDESGSLTVHFSKEELKDFLQASDLVAHSVPNKKFSEFITYLVRKEINQKTKIKRPARDLHVLVKKEKLPAGDIILDPKESHLPIRRALKPNTKKAILQKNKCCQYQDSLTKKICGSTRFLQIDHIQPVFAGGTNDPANLRILCAQHNQFRYQKESHP